MQIGRAVAEVIYAGRRSVVVLGRDTRASSEMLCAALTAGLCAAGADVRDVGVIPTPAVSYLTEKYKADAGIMVSASHNPAEYNGIKVFGGDGCKLPDALEEQVEALVLDGGGWPQGPMGCGVGRVTRWDGAVRDYVDHLKATVPEGLSGLRIAVDCANGAAAATAKLLFAELGAEAVLLADAPDGGNINFHCGSTHLAPLQEYVRAHGLDAGVAFDGDADRCLCVDERGEPVDGDGMLAICAGELAETGRLPHRTVVGTVMSNFGLRRFCAANDLKFVATKVGDRFVLEQMLLGGYALGGEQSGHLIFREYAATGDGQLTAIQLLRRMRRKGQKLSALASVMLKYPQVLQNIVVSPEGKVKFYTNDAVQEAIRAAEAKLGDSGRIVVRPSGTEPVIRIMTEGMDPVQIQAAADTVAAVLRQELGRTP